MVYNQTMSMVHREPMTQLNIHEAKTQLSKWLTAVERGETIILCRRNVPIAEIRPLTRPRSAPRPVGLALEDYGPFDIPNAFFEPLPDEVLDAFEGGPS
jgi:antitoxin (DNA-binding transcriptional repressor) of toxin-antitoxin stability system